MRIGEAAEDLGVATHVLRHWDDEGVVVPDRSPAGHRDYSEEHLARLRILLACQGAGMSLGDISRLLHRDEAGRDEIIAARLVSVRGQRARLERTEAFLEHVLTCRHPMVTRCADCMEFSSGEE